MGLSDNALLALVRRSTANQLPFNADGVGGLVGTS
jgi:hypothetical protein